MVSVKDQILRDRKPTSSIMEAIRRKLAGKGKLTIKEKAELKKQKDKIKDMYGDSGRKGQTRNRKSTTVKGDPRTSMKPRGMPKRKSTVKSMPKGDPRVESFQVKKDAVTALGGKPKRKTKAQRTGLVPDTVPQERKTTPAGKAASIAKAGPSSTRKKNTAQTRKPAAKAQSGISPVPKKGTPPPKRPKSIQPKPGKPNTEPRTIAQAKKMGKLYFVDKNGKKKAAVTAEDLKKSGHKTLRAYLNAKGKPAKKGK